LPLICQRSAFSGDLTEGVFEVDLQYEKANAMRREKKEYLRNGLRFGTEMIF
jgi:hypothetical protein